MNERTVTETTDRTAAAEESPALVPAVDIFEDATGITLKADLPGVSRERLSIEVDRDTLSIEGEVQIDIPEGTESLYADLRATRFRRSFTLSQELEADKIAAQMNDGELTLTVPKRAEVQPRKIEVKVG
jgi:HSP20 family protein